MILADYCLVITWLAAAIVVEERYIKPPWERCFPPGSACNVPAPTCCAAARRRRPGSGVVGVAGAGEEKAVEQEAVQETVVQEDSTQHPGEGGSAGPATTAVSKAEPGSAACSAASDKTADEAAEPGSNSPPTGGVPVNSAAPTAARGSAIDAFFAGPAADAIIKRKKPILAIVAAYAVGMVAVWTTTLKAATTSVGEPAMTSVGGGVAPVADPPPPQLSVCRLISNRTTLSARPSTWG